MQFGDGAVTSIDALDVLAVETLTIFEILEILLYELSGLDWLGRGFFTKLSQVRLWACQCRLSAYLAELFPIGTIDATVGDPQTVFQFSKVGVANVL